MYGIRVSHIVEILRTSNEKLSIPIETPSVSIEILGISNRKF